MLEKLLDILYNGDNNDIYKIGNNSLSYSDCYYKVLELSDNLKKEGNSPIIIYGDKDINTFIAILSCIVAKRCYIPLYKCTPFDRINDIIKRAKVSLIITDGEINIDGIDCLSVEEINKRYNNIKKYYQNNNKYAYIIFTSGSTGESKGVPISYDNLNHFIEWVINLDEFKNCNRINVLSQASFSFDLSVMDIYFSIYKNNSIISVSSNDRGEINKVYNIIKENNINFLIMTPTFIKMLLIDKEFNENNYPNIKYMFFCGELLEVTTVKKIKERFKKVKVINAYGPTEATCFVTLLEIKNSMLEKDYLPVGNITNSAVNISIQSNEIVLDGESVFDGYFGTNKRTKEYHTGDIGYLENSYLYCKGRIDNQIKYMGYRIELGDIENNLLKIKKIKEAVVISKNKEKSNVVKIIKAYVVVDGNVSEDYIKEELSKLIPSYMMPKVIEILDSIPVNNNGKYDRRKLSEF